MQIYAFTLLWLLYHVFQCARYLANAEFLLLARLIGQYCFARWCLLSVVVCNAVGGRAGRNPGAWAVSVSAARRVGSWLAYTPWRASMVTSHKGDTLLL